MSKANKEFMGKIVVEEDSVVSLAEEELDNIVFENLKFKIYFIFGLMKWIH